MIDKKFTVELPPEDMFAESSPIIKVIGVGGGGSNAVNHMYGQNVAGVSYVVCNTDGQALRNSPVPTKLLIGPNVTRSLGAGNDPERAASRPKRARTKSPSSLPTTPRWCLSPPVWAAAPAPERPP